MILSGPEIRASCLEGSIIISPFEESRINPNSYNYQIGTSLIEVSTLPNGSFQYRTLPTSSGAWLLLPGKFYLASTFQLISSDVFVITLLGRSSLGRLGLFLNITADLGHVGSESNWTLELHVVQPLKIYPEMTIGQVAFWTQEGEGLMYRGRYYRDTEPVPSRDPDLTKLASGRGVGS